METECARSRWTAQSVSSESYRTRQAFQYCRRTIKAVGETGEQKAVFDLAWPNGIQAGLSQPAAVLLNESSDMIALASGAGYRCFTTPTDFRRYVEEEFLFQAQGV